MAYDPIRKLYTPDFNPPEQPQGWLNMPEDAPIDAGPAAMAFKQRFLGGGPARPDAHELPPMRPTGDMSVAPMGHGAMDVPMGVHGAGVPTQVKPKSL